MMLGRKRIKDLVESSNLLESYSEDCLESCGYDLRVAKAYNILSESHMGVKDRKMPEVKEIMGDTVKVPAGEYILVETHEKVNMPGNIMARILPRSSIFRMGCILATAVVDPGFQGTLTMGFANMSKHDFTFEKKSRRAQLVFEEVSGETVPYDGKYQGGKVV